MPKLYIGTSGFSYSHWEEGVFYPKGLAKNKQLEYYSQHFQTVELNNPFYHLPPAKTFQNWHQRTPKNFIFTVKVSRYITHIKRLKNCREPWQRFIANTKELKEKLGPILFQLPPNWRMNIERLERFLKILPKKYQYSFEFRHSSWFNQEIYDILKKHRIALCLADSNQWPYQEEITADFIYLRLHGSHRLCSAKYTDKELKNWAGKIKKWRKLGKDIFVYFNNDFAGYAVKNTLILKRHCEERTK
jgi:uncharacterized protein YecE (DUF72 family)